jgi:hypothetical protein
VLLTVLVVVKGGALETLETVLLLVVVFDAVVVGVVFCE